MCLSHNQILPFTIDSSALGGRVVRMHDCINTILQRHNYPYAVSVLLGEFITLGVSLATALKCDGVCTFEARGNGAVSLLVADITANGAVRGYAEITGDIATYSNIQNTLVSSLMGTGHMMFTVDQASTKHRYQGIVELNRPNWEQCMAQYFKKSMQCESVFRVACTQTKNGWVSGCVALQKMPKKMPKESHKYNTETENENWNRLCILLKSLTGTELTDIHISNKDLLLRLYHQEAIRIYTPTLLHDTCRCSRQKMLNAIMQIPESERGELLDKDGVISVHCAYCATTKTFTPQDIGYLQN